MKEIKGQQIVICPQCGENKVKSSAPGIFQILMAIGILMCITIVGIPFGLIFIISAFIARKSKIRLKFRCMECKHDFKINENTYDDYMKAIAERT